MEVYRQITANNISLREYPFKKELAMEAYLLENEDILSLDKGNFNEVEVLDAEIALKQGRKTDDGRIDILMKYSGEYLGIAELKLNRIDLQSLKQLEDYIDQKELILQCDTSYWNEAATPKWVGLLVGTEISNDLRDLMLSGYTYNGTPIAAMTVKRFRSSENEIFVVSDTYFKNNYQTNDYSGFLFRGKEYNKARLVNAVLHACVEQQPTLTVAELQQKFPKEIQGVFGVFTTKARARSVYDQSAHKRYNINPDEEICLADDTICTCTQWNPTNIKAFITQAQTLGFRIDIL